MRKHKCSPFGQEVDLDDPNTYDYMPKDVDSLRDRMFKEIGYTYCYMNFWHKEWDFSGQRERVDAIIDDFTKNERENFNNILWRQEKLFLLEDEIENQC